MTFACQFGRYRFTGLPFGVAQLVDMFNKKLMRYSKI